MASSGGSTERTIDGPFWWLSTDPVQFQMFGSLVDNGAGEWSTAWGTVRAGCPLIYFDSCSDMHK